MLNVLQVEPGAEIDRVVDAVEVERLSDLAGRKSHPALQRAVVVADAVESRYLRRGTMRRHGNRGLAFAAGIDDALNLGLRQGPAVEAEFVDRALPGEGCDGRSDRSPSARRIIDRPRDRRFGLFNAIDKDPQRRAVVGRRDMLPGVVLQDTGRRLKEVLLHAADPHDELQPVVGAIGRVRGLERVSVRVARALLGDWPAVPGRAGIDPGLDGEIAAGFQTGVVEDTDVIIVSRRTETPGPPCRP